MRPPAAWLAVAGLLIGVPSLAQEVCPDNRAPAGDLGIEHFRCLGGDCAIYLETQGGPVHRFTTEPRLHEIDPRGPSAGKVREGDVLVAVDGRLITTLEGGRRLASLETGTEVQLWLRRDGRDVRVEVVPKRGCGVSRLTVSSGPGRRE